MLVLRRLVSVRELCSPVRQWMRCGRLLRWLCLRPGRVRVSPSYPRPRSNAAEAAAANGGGGGSGLV